MEFGKDMEDSVIEDKIKAQHQSSVHCLSKDVMLNNDVSI